MSFMAAPAPPTPTWSALFGGITAAQMFNAVLLHPQRQATRGADSELLRRAGGRPV